MDQGGLATVMGVALVRALNAARPAQTLGGHPAAGLRGSSLPEAT